MRTSRELMKQGVVAGISTGANVRAALSARGLRPDLGRAPGHFASENYW